jgi:Ca-activated chloride channel family protein
MTLVEVLAWIGLPLLVLFFVWAARRRRVLLERFAGPEMAPRLTRSVSYRKRRWKRVLLLTAVALCLLALARPQWGMREQWMQLRGLDVLVAIDTSRSMDAEDIQPSRLIRAKEAIRTLLGKLRGDRVGLIAFAGSAYVQCPPTIDYSAVQMFLDAIDTELIGDPGTDLEKPIRLAMESFDRQELRYKVLILMTDGEGHTGDPLAAAKEAAEQGIVIYTVGFGSPSGGPVPERDETGKVVGYKKDRRGKLVTSKLDEETLRKIALATGGKYFPATTEEDELDLIQEEISGMERRRIESRLFSQREDYYQPFLLAAVLLLALEFLLTDRRKDAAQGRTP